LIKNATVFAPQDYGATAFFHKPKLIIRKLFLRPVAGHKNSGQKYPLLFARYFFVRDQLSLLRMKSASCAKERAI
jgi:hypothetical protein